MIDDTDFVMALEKGVQAMAEEIEKTPQMLQYENETGKKGIVFNAGFVPTSDYIVWLEAKVAVTEGNVVIMEYEESRYCRHCKKYTNQRCLDNPTCYSPQD